MTTSRSCIKRSFLTQRQRNLLGSVMKKAFNDIKITIPSGKVKTFAIMAICRGPTIDQTLYNISMTMLRSSMKSAITKSVFRLTAP